MHVVNIENLDLNLLVALDALLDERHVSRAAHRLGLSQPAVSHALRRLREAFGDELLVRTKEGLTLTTRAEGLAAPLRAALDNLQAAVGANQLFTPGTSQRVFSLGTSDYAELVLLPPLLRKTARAAPQVDLWVRRYDNFESRLQQGELDLALTVNPRAEAGLRSRILFRDRFVVIMRKGHPLAKKKLTVAAYANAAHAFIAPGGTRGGVVDTALAKLGRERRVAVAVPHFLVAPYIVAETDLLLTVAERIARACAKHLPIRIVEAPLTLPDFGIAMLWHERTAGDPGHQWLRQQLVEIAAKREST